MWINETGSIVIEHDAYTTPDGTQYPAAFPKAEIPGLTQAPDPAPVPPTPAEISAAMDGVFDATAQAKRYKDRVTCAMRAGYPGPFHAEGVAFATWMDEQNAKAYAMLAQVQAGKMEMPATIAAALALLDPMVWP